MFRNDRGLNKRDAEFLAGNPSEFLSFEEKLRIVSRYTHTQLVDAVTDGELTLPRKRPRRPLIEDSERSEDEKKDEQENEDEEETAVGFSLDRYAMRSGEICFPSRHFVDRVARMVGRARRGVDASEEVYRAIRKQDQWTGYEIERDVIDAALYYSSPRHHDI